MRIKKQGKPTRTNVKWTYNFDPIKKGLALIACGAIAWWIVQQMGKEDGQNTITEGSGQRQLTVQKIENVSKKQTTKQSVGIGIEGMEQMSCWVDDQGNKTYTNLVRPMNKAKLKPCP